MIPVARIALFAGLALTAACGQKGAPLAPLHLVPGPAADLAARRLGPDVRLQFIIPSKNVNGPGPVEIDRVEIYAVTIAPGAAAPPNRELLKSKYVVGTVPVKPPPVEGEAAPENSPADTRLGPGEPASFVERLTEDKLKPVTLPVVPPAAPAAPPPSATATAAAAPPAPPAPTYPLRIYVTRGMTKKGRAGQPSARVQVPIVPPPAAPTTLTTALTEKAIVLKWIAPPPPAADPISPSDPAAATPAVPAPPVTFNVYNKPDSSAPLNAQPIAAAEYERTGITFGTEQCFIVRSVAQVAAISIESEPSAPLCVTPADTFAPAAPKGLSVVAAPGTMNLSWDANAEPDVAGYVVLRGEAPGETLQPLTPAPIPGTSYEDKTAKPGVRYAYAIVAVDKAAPPNKSAPSARLEETAR